MAEEDTSQRKEVCKFRDSWLLWRLLLGFSFILLKWVSFLHLLVIDFWNVSFEISKLLSHSFVENRMPLPYNCQLLGIIVFLIFLVKLNKAIK